MRKVSASTARKEFSDLLSHVAFSDERIVIHRNGKAVAALISVADLAAFEVLEDRADVETARSALAESDERVPWEKVKAELNL